MSGYRVLAVDDEPSMRQFLEVLLSRAGYSVRTAGTLSEAVTALDESAPDLVITDMRLGRDSGLALLRSARARGTPPEVIVITAYGTPSAAVEAMRAGAYDYIAKPFDNEELLLLVQKALERRRLEQENRRLKESLSSGPLAMVGNSPGLDAVRQMIRKVAASRSTVLITGESGTGKELVARAIHLESSRAAAPFVAVNCAAIAENLLESELFGHLKGAFTGATSDRKGIMASAEDGTVFLDEVAEVSPALQVKLLRALQERKVRPVGGTSELAFEGRIVAATNRELEAEVRAGRFREDLFYRLNVIAIHLPPLRQRREDIPLLAEHFLRKTSLELERPGLHFSSAALEVLGGYDFPGNVRQLQNIIERAATLSETDELGPESLPTGLSGLREPEPVAPGPRIAPGLSLERELDALERRYLEAALKEASGVKTRAAELLGLTFRSFRYRLAKHAIGSEDELPAGPGEPPDRDHLS